MAISTGPKLKKDSGVEPGKINEDKYDISPLSTNSDDVSILDC